MSAREPCFPGQIFQNPSSVRCSVQSAGSREALRINVLALSCCGWRGCEWGCLRPNASGP
jgi:hypothetical protein